MVTAHPALACLALALAAGVVPADVGRARLAGLGRPGAVVRGRRLPAAAVTLTGLLVGLLALGPAGSVAGGAVAAALHRGAARSRAAHRAGAATLELADALGRIAEELRAGAHPAAALRGTAGDGPLAREILAPAAAAAALGDGVAPALVAEADRRPEVARDLRRIAQTWGLADRHGMPVADLLTGAVSDLRWRVAYGRRVRAQLAGPRATAAVLTVLPVLGIGLGELVGAAPLAVLRSGLLGQLLVVAGAGLGAAGAAWTARILGRAVPR